MNVTKTIENITPFQQLIMALVAICASFGAVGYTASDIGQPQTITEELSDFDVFAYQAKVDVKPMMNKVLNNPTDSNLLYANNHLAISIKNFESRETGENKELFKEYRIACQEVIDSIQAGEKNSVTEVKIKKMDAAYLKLNPN